MNFSAQIDGEWRDVGTFDRFAFEPYRRSVMVKLTDGPDYIDPPKQVFVGPVIKIYDLDLIVSHSKLALYHKISMAHELPIRLITGNDMDFTGNARVTFSNSAFWPRHMRVRVNVVEIHG